MTEPDLTEKIVTKKNELNVDLLPSGIDQIDVELMRFQIMGLASANKTVEARLLKVERQLAAMMSNQR